MISQAALENVQEAEVRNYNGVPAMETMRYSQLVERYLKTHKYECFNVVRPWKCRSNDRTELHRKDIRQFAGFVQCAKSILAKNSASNIQLNEAIEKEKKELNRIV